MPDASFQHRFYLGPCRPGGDPTVAHRYWRECHRQTVGGTDYLLGYVQNRPLASWWDRIPYLVCAETWFATREDEAAFYAAEYFSTVIVPDEHRIIDRAASWNAAVVAAEILRDGARGPWRAMAFGGDREELDAAGPEFTHVEALQLRRPVRDGDEPVLLSAWTADRDAADALAVALGGVAFVANPVPVVGPPAPGWEAAAEVDGAFAA
jgi:hypothetical protein